MRQSVMRRLGVTFATVAALGCGGLSDRHQSDGTAPASPEGDGGGDSVITCSEGSSRIGDVRLASQSEVTDLAGVSQVEGSIRITGEVTDLGPLHCLRRVTGSLVVFAAEHL